MSKKKILGYVIFIPCFAYLFMGYIVMLTAWTDHLGESILIGIVTFPLAVLVPFASLIAAPTATSVLYSSLPFFIVWALGFWGLSLIIKND